MIIAPNSVSAEENCDIDALDDFVKKRLDEGDEFLRNKIRLLVQEYHHLNAASDKSRLSMKISVQYNCVNMCKTIEVSPNSTLLALKMRLEYLNPSDAAITSLFIDRTQRKLSTLNSKTTLEDCGIHSGDRVVVDYSSGVFKGEKRIRASGLTAESGFQYFALLLHAFMLDEGFRQIVEIKNAMQGYRPLCKELHTGVFLRPNWNADPGSITILYKRGGADVFMLSCEDMMGTILVALSVRAREVNRYIEMHIGEYIDEKVDNVGAPAFAVRNEKALHKELEKLVKSVIPDLHVHGHLAQAKGMSIKDLRVAAIKAGSARCFYFGPNPTVVPHDTPTDKRNNFPKPPRKPVTDPTSKEFNSPFHHPFWGYQDFKAQREKVLSDEIELEKLRAAVKTEESFWKGGCNYAKMGVRDCNPVVFESGPPGSSAAEHQQQTVSRLAQKSASREWPTLTVPVIPPDIEPRSAVIACHRQVPFVSATNGALPRWSESPVHHWDMECYAAAEARAAALSAAEQRLAAMDAAARSPVSGHYKHANDDGIIRGPYSPPTPIREAEDELKRMRRAAKNFPPQPARVVPPPSRSLLHETTGELPYTTRVVVPQQGPISLISRPLLSEVGGASQGTRWEHLEEQARLLAVPQSEHQAAPRRAPISLQLAAPQQPHLMHNVTELYPVRAASSRLRLDEERCWDNDSESTDSWEYSHGVERKS